MPISRVQAETTSSQFVKWLVFLKQKRERLTRMENYLISIATEVRRSYVKHPHKVKFEHLKLKEVLRKKPTLVTDPNAIALADAMWRFRLGVKKDA